MIGREYFLINDLLVCCCLVLQGQRAKPKHVPTVEEVRMWKGSQYWLGGAAAAVGAYILLSGQYVQFQTVEEDDPDALVLADDDDNDDHDHDG
jgi:hypothetical protein